MRKSVMPPRFRKASPRRLAIERLENRVLLDAGGLAVWLPGAATDLGELVFYRDQHVDLSGGDLSYEFRAAHDAILAAEASSASGSRATIALFDAEGNLLAEQEGPTSRIDHDAVAGRRYFITLSGGAADLDLRIANQVGRDDGDTLPIFGSPGDDVFEIASSGLEGKVNGIAYTFTPAALSDPPRDRMRLSIDGGGGNDTVQLRGLGAELHASPELVAFVSMYYEADASRITYVHAYGEGDGDVAYLDGSAGQDKLKIEPDYDHVKLIGSGYTLRAKFFERVVVDTGEGEDLARVWDTPSEDHLFFQPGQFQFISLAGWDVRAAGIESAIFRSTLGGADRAILQDSPGDDLFFARPHKSIWSGPGFDLTVRGASFIEVYSTDGGCDRAKLHGSQASDQFETLGRNAGLSQTGGTFTPLYAVHAFDWVKAYAHGGEQDVCALDPDAAFETVLDGEWTEVSKEELTERLLQDGGGFF